MKINQLLILLTFGLLALLLSACTGSAAIASSWPGLTAGGKIVYLAYNQHVYAINLSNGSEKWRFPAEADRAISFFAPPSLTLDGQVLVGGYNNTLYSLDSENGQEKWKFQGAKDRFIGSPLVTPDSIFAPAADGNLYALDLTGNLKWTFTTQAANWAKPSCDPECTCIFLPSMDHRLYSIDARDGNMLWKTDDLGGSIVGSPTLGPDNLVVVGTFASEVVAIDRQSGEVRWRAPTSGWIWGGPIFYEDRLYFGDLKGTFYALDANSGELAWQLKPDGPISETPLVWQDTLYISTEVGTLYAVDLDGNIRWNKPIGGKLYTSAVGSGDLILVSPLGSKELLFALDSNGNQKWVFTPEK